MACFYRKEESTSTSVTAFYGEDPELPYLCISEALKPVNALDLLLNSMPTAEDVCKKKPVFVKKAAVFLVDTNRLGSPDDLKADDLGAWNHKGKPVRKYKVVRSQSGTVYGADRTQESGSDIYKLTRVYYHHASTPEFRRTIFYAHGEHFLGLAV